MRSFFHFGIWVIPHVEGKCFKPSVVLGFFMVHRGIILTYLAVHMGNFCLYVRVILD